MTSPASPDPQRPPLSALSDDDVECVARMLDQPDLTAGQRAGLFKLFDRRGVDDTMAILQHTVGVADGTHTVTQFHDCPECRPRANKVDR